MASTKIINVLKDDSFEEILDIFNRASAKEVIFVLPKKSKAFKKENDFAVLSTKASEQNKTVSLLCSNPDVNQLAKKYDFDVLITDEGKPSLISAVNQFEEKSKPRLELKEDLPPWGNLILPGLPVEEKPEKPELKAKIKIPKVEIKPAIQLDAEMEVPQYQLARAVKIRKVEDIIKPENETSVRINPKKEKSTKINIRKSSANEDDEEKALKEIKKVWQDQGETSSNIWSDWNFNSKEKIGRDKERGGTLKFPIPNLNFKKLGKFNFSKFTTAMIVVAIFVLGSLIYISTGSAKITIMPRKQPLDLRIKLSASDKYTALDAPSGKIPGQLFTVEKELSQKFDATGQKDDVQKARGKITIYNETNSSQPLVATTRFESEGKLVFRTMTSVVVPAAKVKNDKVTPGTVDVDVIADKPGSEYNISVGRFVIVAFREKGDTEKYNKIFATLSGSMHGGINGKSTVVTDSDYSTAKETLTQQLSKDLREAIKVQTSQFMIVDTIGLNIQDPISTAGPDDATTDFTINLSGSIKTIGFKETDLYEIINNYVQKTGNLMVRPDKVEVSFEKAKLNLNNNLLEFEVVVKGNAYAKIDEDKILDDLIGKKENEIRDYLAANPDIDSAKVVLSPFWINKMPKERERVDFKTAF